jgi:two-component system, sensor histidine kinase and response regulator
VRYYLPIFFFSLLVQSVQAQTRLDRLWQKIDDKDTTGRIKSCLLLLDHYFHNEKLDTAALLSIRLIEAAQKANSKKYEYAGYSVLADIYYNNGDYPNAIAAFEKGLLAQHELGGKEIASIFNDIGRAYRRLGDQAKAIEYFFKSVELAHEQKNIQLEATVYNNMALVFSTDGNDSIALDYHYKSLELHKAIGDSAGMALCYSNIGGLHQSQGKIREASENFELALRISELIHDKKQLGFAYSSIASLALLERDYKKALEFFTKAKSMYEAIHVTVYVAESKVGLSETHLGLANYALAIKLAEEALATGEQIQSPELIAGSANQLSIIHKQNGDFKKSLHYLEIATKANSQLRKLESKSALENYNAKYALEKKQLEVEALEKDLKLKQAQEQRERIINYVLIIGTIFLLLVAFILWRVIRQKQTANMLLQNSQHTVELQNAELRQLGVVKDKLLSITAHDFRGPLASINGLIPLLSGNYLSEAERTSVLESLTSQLNATSYFLENLLQWSKNQFTTLSPKLEHIEIPPIVVECIQLLAGAAVAKKITIQNNLTNQEVLADVEMLRFVFRNLLSNAIKFSHEGKMVLIESTLVDESIHFSIIDSGVGIPNSQLNQLFKLETIITSGTRNERGTGLGLALCKDFVLANGGTIWVESKEGVGTTFTFSLPISSYPKP